MGFERHPTLFSKEPPRQIIGSKLGCFSLVRVDMALGVTMRVDML